MIQSARQTMTAVIAERFGPPDVLRLVERPWPAIAPGEILVKVAAAAVTPLDCYLRSGVKVGTYNPVPPYTPGGALSGTIAAIGAEGGRFRVGDRVYGVAKSGSCASHALCDADALHPLPACIEAADGALISVPYRTAYHSLVDLARAVGGETVLVQGAAGSVGAAATQLARALGLRVIATCAPGGHDQARADGAHHVVNHREPDWPAAVRAAAQGSPLVIILEVAARANLALDLDLAAPGGRIIVIGGHGDTQIDPLPVIGKGLSLFGVSLPRIGPRREAEIMAALGAGLENGTLRPRCATRFALAEAAAAHTAIEAGQGSGGVALVID